MATNVKVIGPGFKQITVKVNPGTHLTDVLEQACTKFKVNSNKYLLKHKEKQIDLSHTWRTVGLAPGASLELVVRSKSPTVINVGLQLPPPDRDSFPPHGRLTEKLPSDLTLWKVLRQFESGRPSQGKNLNITARGTPRTDGGSGSGQLYYETPVLRLGNDARQFSTFVDFQRTLSQLGYNSSGVLIHLSYQPTDKSFTDAITEIDQYFKEEEASVPPSESAPPEPATTTSREEKNETESSNNTSAPDNSQQQPDTDSMDVDEPAPSSSNRTITIFEAPSSSTPAAAREKDSEESFLPGVDHAKAHQRLLKTQGENKRLLSDRELEEKATAAREGLANTRSVSIKVRLPDNTSVQASFGQDDTGASLYSVVRSLMANPDAAFKLVIPPGHDAIRDSDGSGSNKKGDSSKLIMGYGLKVNTMVNFVWADSVDAAVRKQPVLQSSAAAKAQKVFIPPVPEAVAEEDDAASGPVASSSSTQPGNSRAGGGAGAKIPKWLQKGLGKK